MLPIASPYVCRLLAGLEAGFVGGAAMLAWIAALSALAGRQVVWVIPNLLASLFYGPDAASRFFHSTTWSGLALHFLVTGTAGMLFALLARESSRRGRLVLAGMLLGLVWYHFSDLLFWRTLGPLVAVYRGPRSLLAPHLLFGACLGAWYLPSREAVRRNFES